LAIQLLDRAARLPASASDARERFSVHDDWWMTDAERLALTALLSVLRPECAIEVGVYRAGSLSVLARHSKKVYALDIDPQCEALFASQFSNVQFVTGDAKDTLPQALQQIAAAGEALSFILIDADHSREGIQRDINSVLRFTPTRPLYLLMHDSFNPECRRGMIDADWSTNPHAHVVELDFVPGRFVTAEEPDSFREMWCGFALAVLLPERRTGPFVLHENESLAFRTALRRSVYRTQAWWNPIYGARELRYRAKRALKARAPALYELLRQRLRPTTR
jgi:hypothetical protein